MHRPHEEIWFIDFAASWCRPCNRMFPEFKKAAKMLQGTIKFGHVECPENQALCER
jgi:thioredoxin-like negative regulator of GroEL